MLHTVCQYYTVFCLKMSVRKCWTSWWKWFIISVALISVYLEEINKKITAFESEGLKEVKPPWPGTDEYVWKRICFPCLRRMQMIPENFQGHISTREKYALFYWFFKKMVILSMSSCCFLSLRTKGTKLYNLPSQTAVASSAAVWILCWMAQDHAVLLFVSWYISIFDI